MPKMTVTRAARRSPLELAAAVLAGERRAAARLMRLVDDAPREARAALSMLYPHTGRAHVVGITGNPGAGKSTLVSALIRDYRAAGQVVGVVAVDPSSPFTGGAILGDRVRMMEHAADPGVFIRSVATRGALGGLSRSTEDISAILDALGCGVVLIETVGVGQSEVEIMGLAQTVVVVLTPGHGDDVQALKAGLMEIADIFVINKADLPGAREVAEQVRTLSKLRPEGRDGWRPPVLIAVAKERRGVAELVTEVRRHRDHLAAHPSGRRRELARMTQLLLRILEHDVRADLLDRHLTAEALDALLPALIDRQDDPYAVAAELLDRYRK